VLHVLSHSACVCVEVPVVSTVHWPVAPLQVYFGAQLALHSASDCVPAEVATHFFVVLSQE
jgi:hypothetical protein